VKAPKRAFTLLTITLLNKRRLDMTNKALSIFNQLRPVTIGFDNVFDHFERMFEDDFRGLSVPNFPPYNIVKTGKNTYDVELALAGYSKKDIDVSLEDGVLTIKSIKEEKEDKEEDGVIHKGIAKRYFSKAFTIADDVEVKGAELKDGLLKVSLERIVPESKKPRTIEVK
jgi:molecular chaperone IbpA